MFVPVKPFQPSLMFLGKAERLPLSGVPEMYFTQVSSGLCNKLNCLFPIISLFKPSLLVVGKAKSLK